jgi:NADP-dependent 3-hydroxy acid dehydrogenase YdfG
VRCLIIGCGCRGRLLARELISQGHAVRATTRRKARLAELEAAGTEPVIADPDRVATLVGAFEHVTVVCILLGSAAGSLEQLRALHGSRLEMLLTKLVDTTVRGLVYEARGTVDPEITVQGAGRVREFAVRSPAGYSILEADPAEPEGWLAAAVEAVERAIAPR